VEAQHFHNGFAPYLSFDAEKIFEGAVGEVNFAAAVEQEQAFEHGIKEDLLLGLGVNGGLLLVTLEILYVRLHLALEARIFLCPENVASHGDGNSENGQDGPHNEMGR
jgi:hypothetical protein